MNIMQLIPDELVEADTDGELFTTSLKVAAHFERNHQHIMRSIRNLMAQYQQMTLKELYELATLCDGQFDVTGQSNFGRVNYTDSKGEVRPMYRLNRDGFMLLTMGFTGQKAFVCKQRFLVAFNTLEHWLHEQQQAEAGAFYQLRQPWQAVVDGTQRGEPRAVIAKAAGYKSLDSVTSARARLRELGIPLQ